jgi:S-methylmethionine-dependent homocysteine/selenocysteine methylase
MKLAQKTREVTEFTEESIREGSFNYNKILKNFNEQISIFKKYNIDLIILEMIINPSICKPAIDAALASGLPVWLGLSCGDESEEGDLFAFENSKMKFSETLTTINTNFDAVLLMHSETKNITKGLQEIKSKWNGHLGAYPHKGTYVRPNWNFDKNYTPEMYSKDMQGWVDQGVRIIGSCCGMGPEYTYELKRRFS